MTHYFIQLIPKYYQMKGNTFAIYKLLGHNESDLEQCSRADFCLVKMLVRYAGGPVSDAQLPAKAGSSDGSGNRVPAAQETWIQVLVPSFSHDSALCYRQLGSESGEHMFS